MIFQFFNESSQRLPRKYWGAQILKIEKILKKRGFALKKDQELILVFLDQKPARKLNYQFRQKNYATDVLSFAPSDPHSLGELVFCSQVLKKQALEHGLSFRDEGLYMIIHGILHLLGMDHERSEAEARKMFKLQDEIFEQILKN